MNFPSGGGEVDLWALKYLVVTTFHLALPLFGSQRRLPDAHPLCTRPSHRLFWTERRKERCDSRAGIHVLGRPEALAMQTSQLLHGEGALDWSF